MSFLHDTLKNIQTQSLINVHIIFGGTEYKKHNI
jgi:hypothetical protein